MQIVIDMCKDDFDEICMQARMVEDTGSLFGRIRKSIFHGIPLPKGHGRLIDENNLKHAFISWSMAVQGLFTNADIATIIYNSPTIIEVAESEVEK